MPTITRDDVHVPADVSEEARETYIDNYIAATRGTGRLMLFACDQKIEHLNDDFYGENIAGRRRRAGAPVQASAPRAFAASWPVSAV